MGASSEPAAGVHVADRQHEQTKAQGQHDDVEHGLLPPISWSELSNNFPTIKKRYESCPGTIKKK
jgi:hypothetical protein